MARVFKYPIDPHRVDSDSVLIIRMPRGARVLSIQRQGNDGLLGYQLWAEVTPGQPEVEARLHIAGTGHIVSAKAGSHVATLLFNGGSLVLHVYLDVDQEIQGLVNLPRRYAPA